MGNLAMGNQGLEQGGYTGRGSYGSGSGMGGGGFLEKLKSLLNPSTQPSAQPMQQGAAELPRNTYAGYTEPWYAQYKPPSSAKGGGYFVANSVKRMKQNEAFQSPANRMGMF